MAFKAKTSQQWIRPGNRLNGIIISIAAVFLFSACGSSGSSSPAAPPSPGQLVSWSQAGIVSAQTLKDGLASMGITTITVTSGASCYKLTYETPNPAGSLIHASGLVCLPTSMKSSRPVISYQHGTIFLNSDAPSNLLTSSEGAIGAVLAGLGFISVLPDYLGFGDSAGMLHPYLHAQTLASATVDMNRAARAFFIDPAIDATMNGQLFLAGYSEGGYATLATQRLMEQSLSLEFPLTASEPGDGPYDLTGTADYVVALANQVEPAFTGFFLKAYDSLYNNPSQIADYFSSAYVDVVNTYFNGTYSRSQISSALGGPGVATTTLLNSAFTTSYLGSGETALKAHIAENDIYNWKAAVPTRLFHGQGDTIVPYFNATTAQTTLVSNGSTSVTVVDCNAGGAPTTHDNCAIPFAIDALTYFKSLAGL
jgi:pimeloyl-ACP methyl ester carboxylesterase